MIISKVYTLKEEDSICFCCLLDAMEEGKNILGREIKENDLEKKAMITFNDGDIIVVCNPDEVLKKYDELKKTIMEDKLTNIDDKKCPVCGKDGEIYLEIGKKIYHTCREHTEWLLNQDNWS